MYFQYSCHHSHEVTLFVQFEPQIRACRNNNHHGQIDRGKEDATAQLLIDNGGKQIVHVAVVYHRLYMFEFLLSFVRVRGPLPQIFLFIIPC